MNIMTAARARTLACVMGLLLLAVPWTVVSAGQDDGEPYIEFTFTPHQEYYDVFDDESAAENVTIRFAAKNTGVEMQNFSMEMRLWASDNPGYNFMSMDYSNFVATIQLSHEWLNNTEYVIEVTTYRVEYPDGQDTPVFHELANDSRTFNIGKEPDPQPLEFLGLTCALGDDGEHEQIDDGAHVWEMMLEDYGSYAPELPSVLGILECYLSNPNEVDVAVNLTFEITGLSDGPGFDAGWLPDTNIGKDNASKELNISLDCGSPSSCEVTNGKITINVDIHAQDKAKWSGNSVNYDIYYSVGENVTAPAPVPGCMDESATNFDVNATVDDGSCIYPPVPPTCLLCNLTTEIPGNVSVNTSATFSVDATGTEGWQFYGGESVYWDFNGTIIQGAVVEHTFTSLPDEGTSNVTVCVQFLSGPEVCQTETITVNETLTGYVAHSSQLQSTTIEEGGGVYFSANVMGGLAPYSYEWQFGDGTSSTNESLVHEFAEPGEYNVTVVITDARADQVTLGAVVEIIEIKEEPVVVEVDTSDTTEDTLGDVELTSAALAGGGTLALILLTGYNGRKSRDKMLNKAKVKAHKRGISHADAIWGDDRV